MTGFISFRPLTRQDFPLLQSWLSKPHVQDWWRDPFDLKSIESKYNPRIDGTEPTKMFLIEFEKRPIGWIQYYKWCDYPDHARQLGAGPDSCGIDLAIGELEIIGRGLGARVIRKFVLEYGFADSSINSCTCDPEEKNTRSVRAFEKAGFITLKTVQLRGESYSRRIVVLCK